MKRDFIVSLSLPKTGTTYLAGLLSQLDGCELPTIKEPSFFFSMTQPKSKLLSSFLSPGNLSRGERWYEGLFPVGNEIICIDMSTQYWLYVEEILRQAHDLYKPVFLVIKRDPLDQLVSYVAHLRRGHIPDVSLRQLVEEDEEFANYLQRMKGWNEEFDRAQACWPNLRFVELSFDALVNNPREAVVTIMGENDGIDQISFDIERNPKSYPAFPLLNKLVFSGWARRTGRLLPGFFYSSLVAARKALVKKNLKSGKGPFHEEDGKFIKEYFFQEA